MNLIKKIIRNFLFLNLKVLNRINSFSFSILFLVLVFASIYSRSVPVVLFSRSCIIYVVLCTLFFTALLRVEQMPLFLKNILKSQAFPQTSDVERLVCLQTFTSNYATRNISAPLLGMIAGYLPAPLAPVEFPETQEGINRLLRENMTRNIDALVQNIRTLDLMLTNEMSDPMEQDSRAIANIKGEINQCERNVEEARRVLQNSINESASQVDADPAQQSAGPRDGEPLLPYPSDIAEYLNVPTVGPIAPTEEHLQITRNARDIIEEDRRLENIAREKNLRAHSNEVENVRRHAERMEELSSRVHQAIGESGMKYAAKGETARLIVHTGMYGLYDALQIPLTFTANFYRVVVQDKEPHPYFKQREFIPRISYVAEAYAHRIDASARLAREHVVESIAIPEPLLLRGPENTQNLANQREIETLHHQNAVQDLKFECAKRHYIRIQEARRLLQQWELNAIKRDAEFQRELRITRDEQRILDEGTDQELALVEANHQRRMDYLANQARLEEEIANRAISQPRALFTRPSSVPVVSANQAIQDSQSFQEHTQDNSNIATVPVETNQPSSSAVLQAELAENTERAADLRRQQEGENRRDLLPANSQRNQQGERLSHTGRTNVNAPNVNQTNQ